MSPDPADQLRKLGYELPEVPEPAGSYVLAVRTGSLIFTAGQLPLKNGALLYTGKVGDTVTIEQAREAARACALNALAAAAAQAGGLDNIARIVRVGGFVAASADFSRHPEVLNGASELIGDIFGEAGLHARTAVGVSGLPLDAPVEVELVAELKSD